MLTKEKFGQQYSTKHFDEYYDDENENAIISILSHIGSEDSLLPKYLKYSVKNNAGGWNKANTVSIHTT